MCVQIVEDFESNEDVHPSIQLLFPARFQHAQQRLLRDLDLGELLHAFLSLFLFLQQFAFAADVATGAFGGDVFAEGGAVAGVKLPE